MAGMTAVKRFGTGATVDISDPADPILQIHLKALRNSADNGDITGGVGFTDALSVTNANKDSYAEKIATALLILWQQQQPVEDTDDKVAIRFDSSPYKNFTTINSVDMLEFAYTLRIRQADPTSALDPDDVVSGS